MPIPYPSAIFIREKALVVNLETIRMIIGEADSGDDHVRSFGSQRCVPPIVSIAARELHGKASEHGQCCTLEAVLRSLRLASVLLHSNDCVLR